MESDVEISDAEAEYEQMWGNIDQEGLVKTH